MQDATYESTPPASPVRHTTVEFKRIDPLQAGKVLGLLYAFFSLLFLPFLLLAPLAAQQDGGAAIGAVFMCLFMMIVYPVMGFLMGVIGGFLYNLVAKQIGGIRVDLA